jgi:hypothetical protein
MNKIITTIVNILVVLRIMKEPTVAGALAAIAKTVSKLDKAVVHQTDKANKLDAAALAAAVAAQVAAAEAEKARRAGTKLADLFS